VNVSEGEQPAPWVPARVDLFARATVMVVDDQPANLALLERVLGLAGVERVIAVTDPVEAIARCRQHPPDLLLLDLHMPVMDGFAVMATLQDDLPSDVFLPIIVLTADVTTEARDRALSAGAKDFLTKPFDRGEVLLRIANALETAALHRRLAADNERLRVELDAERAEERRQAAERWGRAERVERVLRGSALAMVFQPIVDLQDGSVVGVEALARISDDPPRSPDQWFADAHAVGLGAALELLAVRRALEALPELAPDVFLAVNLSADTVLDDGLSEVLEAVDGRRVVIELTEQRPVDDYVSLVGALDALRYQGVRVAVDDAGAGYSGLHHILQLRPDIIKMDIDLIRELDRDPVRRALVTSLVSFGADIGARLVAEGIETDAELGVLQGLATAWGQGYHLARPGPLPYAVPVIDLTDAPSG
jgi:EAL domain-containing protein (putative c-di-GMP-specific phosphodiesterase class I)